MKIKYVSDIHLEMDPTGLTHPLLGEGEILVLAGDITVKNDVSWINEAAKGFDYVVYVAGNHEHYHQYIEKTHRELRENLTSNVHFLENESVTLNGVTFHGCTLWTDMNKNDPLTKARVDYDRYSGGMNDFRLIRFKNGEYRWSPDAAYKTHLDSRKFLEDNVKEGDVVVTHHAPTYQSIHPRYLNDREMNGAYASDLSDIMLDKEPALWFHGHVHDSFDYQVGRTRVLCNPRGYVNYELNESFDLAKEVEI